MKPEIKQKLMNAYKNYLKYDIDEFLYAMTGYLDAFFDLGLITEDEFFVARNNVFDVAYEMEKRV